MKHLVAITFIATAFAALTTSSFADTSMHNAMMQAAPTCKAGDPVVGVNVKTKTYMTHDQMKTKMAGMSPDKMHAMMVKNHVKMMCKSQADAMGAKMMKSHM